jgi:phosphate transport system substrate-binding protein
MNRKMKIIAALTMSAFMMMGISACGEIQVETIPNATVSGGDSTNANGETVVLSGDLVLTGSTSMSDVTIALAEEFMAMHPDVTVSVGGNGSGEGPTAVNDGTANIGMLSRNLKDSENPDAYDKYIIGYDGIAVIVNPESQVTDLTLEQITKIFLGEITNWKDVGGTDAPIQVVGREAASGTRGAFEELVGIEDNAAYMEEQNSTGNVKQSVASNPNAIGYVSISAVDETVSAVIIDGVVLSEATVKSGEYVLQRPFVMITKINSTDSLAKAFMDFVYSDAGMKIIADDGIVPNEAK